MPRRILIVEDDQTLRQALTFNLTREGYEVGSSGNGERGLALARSERYDVILLDLMLPGMNGMELLRALRREGNTTPVIILSAKGDEVDRIVGLKVGADDYMSKPFSRPELLARIEAVLRRARRAQSDESVGAAQNLEAGPVVVDQARRVVTIGGDAVHVTSKEFELLVFLASSPGRIYTREQLITRVWGYDYEGGARTVDVHVSWLRSKLRRASGLDHFRTVRGVGYAFEPVGR